MYKIRHLCIKTLIEPWCGTEELFEKSTRTGSSTSANVSKFPSTFCFNFVLWFSILPLHSKFDF